MPDATRDALASVWAALDAPAAGAALRLEGEGALPSAFAVSDLAAATVAAACLALSGFVAARHGAAPAVAVDRRLASFWFASSVLPQGWGSPTWDAVAGDYATADGWIRLHTNAPHHRAAALAVLGAAPEREAVARAVRGWEAEALEAAVVAAGGCAAAMRDAAAWRAHPQGSAVAAEPLLHRVRTPALPRPGWAVPRERPLAGLRVLDLTRVLAGPVSTRFLAGFGAEVLRIDPPDWNEPAVEPDVTLGKRCARLDLRRAADRATLEGLLARADVLVHGYRPGALEGLGLGEVRRRALRPGLVEVTLDAYGWTGPWAGRRGFDSLVQMSSGIAEAGRRWKGTERPHPLPVQALDHATGYLMAAAVLRGLTERLLEGTGSTARASLARTAALLCALPTADAAAFAPQAAADTSEDVEQTSWGPALRLLPPARVEGAAMRWDLPAGALGSSVAAWE